MYPVLQHPLRPIVSSLFDRPVGVNIRQMLFGAGEQGAWYDPSDLSTLFQDSAGTTPVTAVEQPVGRILDKSGRGNHATQATTTKRPVLSRRVNLLTNTEDFQNFAWITPPTGTVKSNNAGTDPLGGGTAGKVECTQAGSTVYVANSVASGLIDGATYRSTCYVRPGVGVTSIVFYNGQFGAYKSATINLITGAVTNSNYTTTPVVSVSGDGFVSISADIVAPDTTGNYCYVQSAGGHAVGDHFFIWHPSLTLATDAHLPYQRVNTATDYDADPAKFPAYLLCDGVDDSMQSIGNVDLSSTSKVMACAGVSKFVDAGSAAVFEHPQTYGNVPDGMALWAPLTAAPNYYATMPNSSSGAEPVVAPSTDVVTGLYDHGGAGPLIRLNGVQKTPGQSVPAGQMGNYPLSLFSRGGTSLFFKGRFYGLVLRGAQTPLPQIEATELYIKQKMRLP